ncbi:hypothetical protein E3T28_15215 [Cryobacterium sinapicolor]|uniref:Restriction endonuclease n=1 Tax=Cryobacterium sinapicolor TaxID=1259236 RepID=A0ABY2ITU1_9MICO|nr:hypothetical protein [Cryobacterium sinapicolor]TFC94397.1 hypothetical protein E3T28_15215 [Cryobacterium sinapicolor]
MPAEQTQEQGRKGVALVQRWLESTTFLELNWNVYDNSAMCEVEHLGGVKYFDLAGSFLGANRREVFVENKNYSSDSGQYPHFQEFLAIAYSATAKVKNAGRMDRATEFIWVTTHPFSIKRWASLASEAEIRLALVARPEFLGDTEVDEDIVRVVAGRIWVLVMHEKQIDLSLTQQEVWQVLALLKRKEATL